jgi:hypothetical protein
MHYSKGLIALILATGALAAAAEEKEASQSLPLLGVTLSPGGIDADGNPSYVDVSTQISGMEFPADAPFLMTPVKFAGVQAVPYEADAIEAADEAGAISLKQTIDDPDVGGFLFYRRWSATRPIDGDITLRYRAPIELVVPGLGSGPPFDLRAAGGGFSGAGSTWLIVPDVGDRPFSIDVHWNVEALKPGSIGVSSFGRGAARTVGPVNLLLFSYYMAGPIGRFPAEDEPSRFSGYWIGTPRFDAYELLSWSERAYGVIAGLFDDPDPPPFTVMLRGNPYQGGGGAALTNSFLVSYPDTREDATEMRETIAHETVHNWVGSIDGPPGSTSWFSEGMTVAYTREFLYRSGLFSADEFLESVNGTATNYYTNPLNDLPNDQIAAGFWKDARIRSLPYSRGSLYFASVDARIRDRSEGQRSLDDLLKAFNEIRKSGETFDTQAWLDLVVGELGPEAQQDFEDMIAGKLIVPPDDAFGPCFERKAMPLRRFELGFDRSALVTEPRVITGLVEGSEAEKAGLRDGDEILHPVALEVAQRDPDHTLTLTAARDGEEFSIEYLPRGEPVDGYQWVHKEDPSDTQCLH